MKNCDENQNLMSALLLIKKLSLWGVLMFYVIECYVRIL